MAATRFSGIPTCVELIDTEAAARLPGSLKARLQEVVRSARSLLLHHAEMHAPVLGRAGLFSEHTGRSEP